ncbi:Glucose-1-phosphate cytidylyltransferase [compost metagenome]
MTGSRIKKIKKYIDNDIFLMTYGDGLADVNIDDLIRFHRAHGRTLTVTGVKPELSFGVIKKDVYSKVIQFHEKPKLSELTVSGGYFVCSANIFDYLGEGDDVVFEEEPMQKLLQAGEVMVYEHSGSWFAMDTYKDSIYLNNLYQKGEAPWVKW